MKIRRRDFLKATASGAALLTLKSTPVSARSVQALPPEAVGILYDSTLCIGCNACMTACKQANGMEPEFTGDQKIWDNPRDLSSKTLNIIKEYTNGAADKKDQVEDGYAFIKRQCLHCIDPSCVTACPVSALRKDPENGIVTYNKDACIGCRYCQVACPYNIPKFQWDDPYPEIVKCQLCSHIVNKGGIAACCSVCPTGASLFGPVVELIEEARRRMQMTPGQTYRFPVSSLDSGQYHNYKVARYVRHIYGKEELGGSQVMYLSAVPFEKFGLPAFPKESFVSMASGIQYAIYKGMVYPLVVLAGLIYMVKKQKNTGEEKKEEEQTSDKGDPHE